MKNPEFQLSQRVSFPPRNVQPNRKPLLQEARHKYGIAKIQIIDTGLPSIF
jgi:hypothetical protein